MIHFRHEDPEVKLSVMNYGRGTSESIAYGFPACAVISKFSLFYVKCLEAEQLQSLFKVFRRAVKIQEDKKLIW